MPPALVTGTEKADNTERACKQTLHCTLGGEQARAVSGLPASLSGQMSERKKHSNHARIGKARFMAEAQLVM